MHMVLDMQLDLFLVYTKVSGILHYTFQPIIVQRWTVKGINFKGYPYFGQVGSKAVLCDLDQRVLIVFVM